MIRSRTKLHTIEDRELAVGSSAHYDDPAYYEKSYQKRTEDVSFYVELGRQFGSVLEYGCGNGRILLPTARAGASVLGVDLSPAMLSDLRAKLRSEPDRVRNLVRLRRGDMRQLRLRERFRLVTCPFNAFLHLYTRPSVERFLARVRDHLHRDGRFVFDVSVPEPEELARTPDRIHRTPPFLYPGVGMVRYGERFDYDPFRQVLFVTMEFDPARGEPWVTPLAHRQFFPMELEALLHYAGFKIEKVEGDFDGPVRPTTKTLVFTAKARRSSFSSSTGAHVT